MRAEKPSIRWIGSPFFGCPRGTRGRGEHKVVAIVNHIMEDTLEGADARFNSEENGGVSVHFGVGKNGEIHQYVRLGDAANHTGTVMEPDWVLLLPDVNPDLYTLGIAHEGYPGEEMPPEQFEATLQLHRWLVEVFSLEVNQDTIIGHCRLNSVDRKNCPGPTFPWEELFRKLAPDMVPFSDVPFEHWAVGPISRLHKKGIITGYPDGTFRGDTAATRYELAGALDRMLTQLETAIKAKS